MNERTIRTQRVGFKWLAHYVDNPVCIGIGNSEVSAINDLQNKELNAAEVNSICADNGKPF